MGARLRCASLTIRTICARSVSLPTRSARIMKLPVPLTVPPVTLLPFVFSTGIGSPVTIDSSTDVLPSITTPSTGTFSPGRTRNRSPGFTRSNGTSSSDPSSRIKTSRLRRKSQQSFDRSAGLASRAEFQHLAQQHQGGDNCSGVEINAHFATVTAERMRENIRKKRCGEGCKRRPFRRRWR